jgi:hypothetical protein
MRDEHTLILRRDNDFDATESHKGVSDIIVGAGAPTAEHSNG